jgi:hypothetical protein
VVIQQYPDPHEPGRTRSAQLVCLLAVLDRIFEGAHARLETAVEVVEQLVKEKTHETR